MAKSKKKKSDHEYDTQNIGDYLVSKSGTKYIKLGCSPKAPDKVKKLIKKLVALLGTDVLFISMIDEDFRDKYNIPDFKKAFIRVDMNAADAEESDDEDDEEEEDDSDDEDEDDSEEEEEEEEEEPKSKKASKKSKAKSKKKDDDEDDEEDDTDF